MTSFILWTLESRFKLAFIFGCFLSLIGFRTPGLRVIDYILLNRHLFSFSTSISLNTFNYDDYLYIYFPRLMVSLEKERTYWFWIIWIDTTLFSLNTSHHILVFVILFQHLVLSSESVHIISPHYKMININ